jgi:glycerophosphoryl diester phosphodiesterase
LYFDAKAIEPEALAEAVERHHMAERTVVYQSLPYLARLKRIDPRIRALPPLSSPEQLQPIAEKLAPYAVDAALEHSLEGTDRPMSRARNPCLLGCAW